MFKIHKLSMNNIKDFNIQTTPTLGHI